MSIGLYLLSDQVACAAPEIRRRAGSDLLRLALAHQFATSPAVWRLGRASSGARLVIDGPYARPPVSLAHTGDLLIAAVAKGDRFTIGVDAERPRPRRYAAIARHLDWPSSLWAQADAPTEDEFLRVWTLWEALFKSMPEAVFADIRDVFAREIGQVSAGARGEAEGQTWSGQSWQCPERVWLSVVMRSKQLPAVRLFRVDRLAGDVESARIKKINVAEDKFHF